MTVSEEEREGEGGKVRRGGGRSEVCGRNEGHSRIVGGERPFERCSRTDEYVLNVVPMWPSRFDMKLKFRVFLFSVNEFESHAAPVANVARSVLERAWQDEESCVLIPIPTSLQTWCTGPPSDHLCVRAQQNSE